MPGVGFLEASLSEYVDVVPAQQQVGSRWYTGTAGAVVQNLNILRDPQPTCVVVLGGDPVYKMDYSVMLAEHVSHQADLTVACLDVALEEACHFGVRRIRDVLRR